MGQPAIELDSVRDTGGGEKDSIPRRWLLYVRIAFVGLVATVVTLNLLALPDLYASQLTPQVLQQLRQQGFSPTLYAVVSMVEAGLSTLTYLAMAVLVFWRRSDDRMALFCAVMLATFGGVAATPLDDITGGGSMPQPLESSPILHTVVYLLVVVGQVSFVTFFYLFPSGHFAPRWTRWCALLNLIYWLAAAVFPSLNAGPMGGLIVVFFVTAAATQIYRYRQVSTPGEREQTKWIVFGVVLAVAIIAIPSVILLFLPPDVANTLYSGSAVGGILIGGRWTVSILVIPIVIAIAVTRSHLWDIDILINRALVYGSLTTLLAALYFTCVVGLQSLSGMLAHQSEPPPVVVVLSTLLIAALFQPLRTRIQANIDRRFYRSKYDAAAALTAFGSALRSELDLTQLSEHLMSVVHETMQPAHVSLWLREPASPTGGES